MTSIVRKVLGAKSKYDKTLPYTYMARIPAIEGNRGIFSFYFADTICGLIEFLDELSIMPADTELFGVYLDEEIPLENDRCLDRHGNWLKRPEICRSLENHYKSTPEARYKGHLEKDTCSFDDRDRRGSGPY